MSTDLNKNTTPNFDNTSSENLESINVKDILKIFKRRIKIIFFTAGSILTLCGIFTVYERIFNPIYKGSFSLLINDPFTTENNSKSTFEGDFFEDIAKNVTQNDIPTLLFYLKSPKLISPVAQKYNLDTKDLSDMISISTEKFGRDIAKGILNIGIKINKKEKGEKILKDLSNTYLQAAKLQKQKKLNEGLKFLDEQAPGIQKRSEDLQRKLAELREKNSFLTPEREVQSLKEIEYGLKQKINKLISKENQLKKIIIDVKLGNISALEFEEVFGEKDKGLIVTSLEQNRLKELLSIEKKIAIAETIYTKNSKVVKSLKAKLNQLKPQFINTQIKAVETAIRINRNKIDTANRQIVELNKEFTSKPLLIKDFNNIKQKLNLAEQNLLSLTSAREKFQLEMAQEGEPWIIIDTPKIKNYPIKPSFPRNLGLGLIVGLLLGFLMAIIRELTDNVFHSKEEIEKALNVPILGHIPHIDLFSSLRDSNVSVLEVFNESKLNKSNNKKEDNYQRFFYQEAFRNLYTSLRFLDTSEKLKIILLTSSIPSEGKSLINLFLAKTLSEMGKKILLIDADLRRPQIHLRLEMDNVIGLSNLLVNPNMKIEKVIQNVPNYKNWDIISSGNKVPDPTRLLGSERFKNILSTIKDNKEYDLVIIDSTPILGLSDSALVSTICDGIILLASVEKVDKRATFESLNRILVSGSNLLGLLTNDVNKIPQSRKISSYGYGYRYGNKGYGYYSQYESYAAYVDAQIEEDSLPTEQNKKAGENENTIFSSFRGITLEIKNILNKLLIWLDE